MLASQRLVCVSCMRVFWTLGVNVNEARGWNAMQCSKTAKPTMNGCRITNLPRVSMMNYRVAASQPTGQSLNRRLALFLYFFSTFFTHFQLVGPDDIHNLGTLQSRTTSSSQFLCFLFSPFPALFSCHVIASTSVLRQRRKKMGLFIRSFLTHN